MKSLKDKLANVEFDHSLWLNELAFTFEEVALYEKRLMKLIEETVDEKEEEKFGVFLIRLIEFKHEAQELSEQIKNHLMVMSQKIQSNGELSYIVNTSHQKTKEQIDFFRVNYSILKERMEQAISAQGA